MMFFYRSRHPKSMPRDKCPPCMPVHRLMMVRTWGLICQQQRISTYCRQAQTCLSPCHYLHGALCNTAPAVPSTTAARGGVYSSLKRAGALGSASFQRVVPYSMVRVWLYMFISTCTTLYPPFLTRCSPITTAVAPRPFPCSSFLSVEKQGASASIWNMRNKKRLAPVTHFEKPFKRFSLFMNVPAALLQSTD